MANPVDNILGMKEYECYVCGKTITYPQWRFGNPLCDKCAKAGDKNYKGDIEW